jgi:hypothetical protein
MLRALTSRRRTVVISIHQPRSSIMAQFDSLLLLSGGRCLFSGRSRDALLLFSKAGHALPAATNPGDFFIDIITVQPGSEAASQARIDALRAAYEAEAEDDLRALRAQAGLALGAASVPPAPQRRLTVAQLLLEFRTLMWRAGLLASRARWLNLVALARTGVFALFLGLIWLNDGRKNGGEPSAVRNLGGCAHFEAMPPAGTEARPNSAASLQCISSALSTTR